MRDLAIGFLGAGQMARALAAGFVRAGIAPASSIHASDTVEPARAEFTRVTGALSFPNNRDVLSRSNVVILAVKPQVMPTVLQEIAPLLTDKHLVISIAAGVRLGQMEQALGKNRRLVRVMPNTPCMVGASASGIAAGGSASLEDIALAVRLFEAVGVACQVSEPLLDAVTGLSGSGPAFVYLMIEALSDGGVRAGLPRGTATQLAAQTVLGAAKMVLETKQHPGALKDMVASPAGTTIAGLSVLEQRAVRGALIDAVTAAADRARQLGETK